MILDAAVNLWHRYRPEEGWLAPILLLAVVGVMLFTVLDVGWVPEDGVIVPAALLGLLMGMVLAKRPVKRAFAWILIILYGLLVTVLTLANLWPPLELLFGDWPALRLYWLENGAFFLERADIWFTAVFAGSRSNETIIFAFLMGTAAWSLAAYAGWSAFRLRRPLLGLTLMGLIVAVNGYYGEAPLEWIIAFVGVALLATAVLHFSNLEWDWHRNQVDYSGEIRLELFTYAALIGAALVIMAFLLPSFSPSKLARAILRQPAFASFEETFDRVFAGVEPPREQSIPPGRAGGTGIMPRAFLLGNPPQLERNIMLTAETELAAEADSGAARRPPHWRGLSYEIYTGRGWSLAEERSAFMPAGEPLQLPEVAEVITIEQQVNWRYDDRLIRYTLGIPERFDQPVIAFWRGADDFVRAVTDDVPRYSARSRVSAATPEQLREVALPDLDRQTIDRYTQLPADFPERIGELTQEVVAEATTPYDQALALESFLRQYPYSLDVTLPPPGEDPVDYFLFDLQTGYCDYYSSSMAVMARTLGLPARVATGFLAQPEDEEGVQTVRQINAHSWTEIYFGDYGWIEFEPTTAFATPHDLQYGESTFYADQYRDMPAETEPPPIPERAPQGEIPWPTVVLLLLGLAAAGTLAWWLAKRPRPDGEVEWAYARLQNNARRLGHPLPPSQTPDEFSAELLGGLTRMSTSQRRVNLVGRIWSPIEHLTRLFVQKRYSGKPVEHPKRAVSLWRRMRWPLWLLWLGQRLGRGGDD